jgi:hypothetical protein
MWYIYTMEYIQSLRKMKSCPFSKIDGTGGHGVK